MVNKEGVGKNNAMTKPIDISVAMKHYDIVIFLLKHGGRIEGPPFVRICEAGDLNVVKSVVKAYDPAITGMSLEKMINQTGPNVGGEIHSPLEITVAKGHMELAEYLVKECKASVGGRPLVRACMGGSLERVRLL